MNLVLPKPAALALLPPDRDNLSWTLMDERFGQACGHVNFTRQGQINFNGDNGVLIGALDINLEGDVAGCMEGMSFSFVSNSFGPDKQYYSFKYKGGLALGQMSASGDAQGVNAANGAGVSADGNMTMQGHIEGSTWDLHLVTPVEPINDDDA